MFTQMISVNAANQVKVSALESFNTAKPSETFKVVVEENSSLGIYNLNENTILNCVVLKVVEPKRGKRNATFYVKPISYVYNDKTCQIVEEMYGKYSKKILSKEELKKIPPTKIIGKTALTVGNYFVHGLSTGVSLAKGMIQNEEDNRIKSGVKKAYKESPLSFVEEGEELDIKCGDVFYLVFKIEKKENLPNYSYVENTYQ